LQSLRYAPSADVPFVVVPGYLHMQVTGVFEALAEAQLVM
jgi:hypothetical protein